MKRIVLALVTMGLLATTVYGQNAELSGKIEIDYEITQAGAEAEPFQLGNWKIDDAELAFKYKLSDVVTTYWSVEAKNGTASLDKGWLSWAMTESALLTLGKFSQVLGPELYSGSTLGMNLNFDFGMGAFDLELSNASSSATTTELQIIPAITIAPELGDDLGLEVITGVAIVTPAVVDGPVGLHYDINLAFEAGDFGIDLEFLASDLGDEAATDGTLFAGLGYGIDIFSPYAEAEFGNLISDADMVVDVVFGVGMAIAEGLKLTPIVNLNNVTDTMDWEFTLRFSASPKVKF